MIVFILRRILLMVPTIVVISVISFLLIQAPPGDYADSYIRQLREQGTEVSSETLENLRRLWGLGEPLTVQYLKWVRGILAGNWGRSLLYNKPVRSLVMQRLPLTVLVSFLSMLFTYLVAVPIGVFVATHQYSLGDYFFTIIGFIGLATPNFLLAILILWYFFLYTGDSQIGLFSQEYVFARWSFAKVLDLLNHMWIPAIVIGTAGTCSQIRILRANLLDELEKPYVMVCKAKGLSQTRLLFKYPFRIALNPFMSTIGWILPALVSGEVIVSVVLGLPSLGPLLLKAITSQDMQLAGSIVLLLSLLTVVGTLISDIALAWNDPRIREAI